jgi:CRP-like cAMP-binding protein
MIQVLLKPSEERKEKDFTILAPVLKEINFFKSRNMINQDIIYLCQELQYEFFTKGETIFKYGEHGNKFYIVLNGKVDIMVPDHEKRQKLLLQHRLN